MLGRTDRKINKIVADGAPLGEDGHNRKTLTTMTNDAFISDTTMGMDRVIDRQVKKITDKKHKADYREKDAFAGVPVFADGVTHESVKEFMAIAKETRQQLKDMRAVRDDVRYKKGDLHKMKDCTLEGIMNFEESAKVVLANAQKIGVNINPPNHDDKGFWDRLGLGDELSVNAFKDFKVPGEVKNACKSILDERSMGTAKRETRVGKAADGIKTATQDARLGKAVGGLKSALGAKENPALKDDAQAPEKPKGMRR